MSARSSIRKRCTGPFLGGGWRALLLVGLGMLAGCRATPEPGTGAAKWPFPVPAEGIPSWTAYRTAGEITVDGRLDETSWRLAPRTPAFVDLVSGEPAQFNTQASLLWDDRCLYIGFHVEEPDVCARLTERDAPIYSENDVEVFIAGHDAYYEFEINALGTVYEVFFIWEDAYERGGFSGEPLFRRDHPRVDPFNGVGFKQHPRGPRVGCFDWDFPGLQTAVQVEGTLNQGEDRDTGWTVELAFPWSGMHWLAESGGRALPPRDGDVWRINCMRFNTHKAPPPSRDSGGWAWAPHGAWDSHIPECFPRVRFSTEPVARGRSEEAE